MLIIKKKNSFPYGLFPNANFKIKNLYFKKNLKSITEDEKGGLNCEEKIWEIEYKRKKETGKGPDMKGRNREKILKVVFRKN